MKKVMDSKIPAMYCLPKTWGKIRPYLEMWGYDTRFVGENWFDFPLLVINMDGRLGLCSNIGEEHKNKYNRKLIEDMDTFLNIAAALKNKIYKEIYLRKTLKKSELTPGMVVQLGDLDKPTFCIVSDKYLISPTNCFSLDEYNEDLTHKKHEELDIMIVRSHSDWSKGFNEGLVNGYILWERPKIKTITKKEIADMLGVNINELNITD